MGRLLKLLGGRPAFSPASLPNLKIWIEATDAATLFQDSARTTPATAKGHPVGGWADKSGTGCHFGQATAGARPTLRISGANRDVEFDGTDDWLLGAMNLGQAQPITMYFRVTAHTAGDYYCDAFGGRVAFGYNVAVANQYSPFAGVGFGSSVGTRQAGLWTVVFNGAGSFLYLAGAQVGTGNAGANSWATPRVGCNSATTGFAAMKLRAFLAYAADHDAATRAQVESYMGSL